MSTETLEPTVGWEWRDDVTEFVINGYTKHRTPVVHTPDCHHVKEAFRPFHLPMLDVVQRFPKTGNDTMRIDLLEILRDDPSERVGWCQHCMVQKVI